MLCNTETIVCAVCNTIVKQYPVYHKLMPVISRYRFLDRSELVYSFTFLTRFSVISCPKSWYALRSTKYYNASNAYYVHHGSNLYAHIED